MYALAILYQIQRSALLRCPHRCLDVRRSSLTPPPFPTTRAQQAGRLRQISSHAQPYSTGPSGVFRLVLCLRRCHVCAVILFHLASALRPLKRVEFRCIVWSEVCVHTDHWPVLSGHHQHHLHWEHRRQQPGRCICSGSGRSRSGVLSLTSLCSFTSHLLLMQCVAIQSEQQPRHSASDSVSADCQFALCCKLCKPWRCYLLIRGQRGHHEFTIWRQYC